MSKCTLTLHRDINDVTTFCPFPDSECTPINSYAIQRKLNDTVHLIYCVNGFKVDKERGTRCQGSYYEVDTDKKLLLS